MKTMVTLVASAAVLLSVPAAAETVFRGQIVWTDAKNCPNARKGDENRSQFHPLIAGNDAFAAITTVHNFGGNSFRPKGGKNFTAVFQEVETGGLGWSVFTGSQKPSFVAIVSATPKLADIKPTTETVILEGKIRNPWGRSGEENCIISFQAVYLRGL